GSATWGNLKELSDHYFSISPKDLTTSFNTMTDLEAVKMLIDKSQSETKPEKENLK
ncbi:MAG: conjugal transfer protein, partial [Lacticaseibacillus paracasei]